jgi:sugar/nucleoside kinase (ribokinase family)
MASAPMTDIYCLGPFVLDNIVEVRRLPGQDEKTFVTRRREAAGGPARNVAAALARWGEHAVLVSAIGDDTIGRRLVQSLADDALSPRGVAILADTPTATTTVIVDATGEKAILIDPLPEAALAGIGQAITPGAGDAVVANFYHPTAVARAFAVAASRGAASFIDLELPEIERWGWDAAFKVASGADMVIANRQVLSAWMAREGSGCDMDDGAEELARKLSQGRGRACVTLGDRGLVACEAGRIIRLPAPSIRPRDTTGAGDVFLAALVRAERVVDSFDEALALATAAAGLFLESNLPPWSAVENAARRPAANHDGAPPR